MLDFEKIEDYGLVNQRSLCQASFMHQLAKMTLMISIVEPSWIPVAPNKFISLKNRWWEHSQNRGVKQIITIRGGRVPESFHRSHFSVLATSVLLVHQMAKRSHPSADEASKFTGASSKSKPEGGRVLALASVRHDQRSPLSAAQEKTQSDVKGQDSPGQASGDRLLFPGVEASGDGSRKVPIR